MSVKLADKTVHSFTTVADWEEAVREAGHNIKTLETDEHGVEYFAEKAEDDDVTMIGYFKDDWGMIA